MYIVSLVSKIAHIYWMTEDEIFTMKGTHPTPILYVLAFVPKRKGSLCRIKKNWLLQNWNALPAPPPIPSVSSRCTAPKKSQLHFSVRFLQQMHKTKCFPIYKIYKYIYSLWTASTMSIRVQDSQLYTGCSFRMGTKINLLILIKKKNKLILIRILQNYFSDINN